MGEKRDISRMEYTTYTPPEESVPSFLPHNAPPCARANLLCALIHSFMYTFWYTFWYTLGVCVLPVELTVNTCPTCAYVYVCACPCVSMHGLAALPCRLCITSDIHRLPAVTAICLSNCPGACP
jgi:hypothetical protein